VMDNPAADRPPVLTPPALTTGTACLTVMETVHGPERGRGERDEQTRSLPHRLRHALAAQQPRAHQVEGVAPVHVGAGFTHRGTPVAAPHGQPFTGLLRGRIRREDLAGYGMAGDCGAGQVHRMGAASNGLDLLAPPRVFRVADNPYEITDLL